jgi:hypothetical protein
VGDDPGERVVRRTGEEQPAKLGAPGFEHLAVGDAVVDLRERRAPGEAELRALLPIDLGRHVLDGRVPVERDQQEVPHLRIVPVWIVVRRVFPADDRVCLGSHLVRDGSQCGRDQRIVVRQVGDVLPAGFGPGQLVVVWHRQQSIGLEVAHPVVTQLVDHLTRAIVAIVGNDDNLVIVELLRQRAP